MKSFGPVLALGAITLAIVAVTAFIPPTIQTISAAGVGERPLFENYDIRLDKSGSTQQIIDLYRSASGRSDHSIASALSRARSAAEFVQRNNNIRVEYSAELHIPEVVSTDIGRTGWLTAASRAEPSVILRSFVEKNSVLFGLNSGDTADLAPIVDRRGGKLTIVELHQTIGGVPVFQGQVKAAITSKGEVVRVVNNLAPGVETDTVSSDFGSVELAVARSAGYVGRSIDPPTLKPIDKGPNYIKFDRNIFSGDILAERFYFPVEYGVVRPAWRVLLWESSDAYYVVLDARDGTLLWRKNITEYQTQATTYNVYGNTTSMVKTADSPAPGTPGCFITPNCPQPPPIGRTSFTLIGNEPPYTFNNLGWIPDGETRTIGNAAEAGIDRDGTQGIDPNGWAFGGVPRNFVYAYNPAPGIPAPGEEPLPSGTQPYPPTQFQQGSITQAFYATNRWHDELYRLGFTETARNFQTDNFGRGGLGGDSISVEIQESLFTNGANFSTTADGTRPRAQVTVWTGPTPDRDGALDSQVVIHELTHGITGRLHGNASGLSTNMSRGMGEGWSDFFALAMLSEPTDDPLGTHAVGCYVTLEITAGFVGNCYYGIRRFPTARRWSVGANGKPHNPLTFRFINSDCNALIGTTVSDPPPSSAFPRGPIGVSTCDQVHNLGEFWSAVLWEVRGFLVEAHGPVEGNRRTLQYITDGMKLAPLSPTMLQERDAILAAVQVSDPSDTYPVLRGFAVRGMGLTASITNAGTGSNNTAVSESFNVGAGPVPPADFDGDGRSDISVFRPSDGVWYLLLSNSGFTGANWGIATDKPVPADYDGDRKTDLAVFRATADPSQPDYYILNSSNSTVSYLSWGTVGDLAVIGDFDGDGKSDPAVFRPSDGRFWVRLSSNGNLLLSRPMPGSTPVAGDFDGDRKTDFCVFANGQWTYSLSSDNHRTGMLDLWGLATDKLVPADYDGDGKTDLAVFRPSDGVWYIKRSTGGNAFVQFGVSGDIPVPGDYDGDTRTDIAVYRDGVWYVNRSSSGFLGLQFGLAGDKPLPGVGVSN